MTNTKVKAFVGGCCASVVGQTIIVPFDVISQHIMLIGLAEQGAAQSKVKRSVTVNARPSQTLNNTGKIVSYKFSLPVLNYIYIEYTLAHH